MRILYYNWVDYLDDEGRGGGVSVYQRNLMQAMAGQPGVETCFLSSGLSYDLGTRPPRWERVRHGPTEDRDLRYEIVNSGVLSPAHHSFGDPAQLAHAATTEVFFDFLDHTGPYDVVHFNNLEGVPAEVLALKARYPQTRVVLSMHNYYPFCPQVNLWQNERRSCVDFDAGQACVTCLMDRHNPGLLRQVNGVAYRLKRVGIRPGGWAFDVGFKWALRGAGKVVRGVRQLRHRRRAASPEHGPEHGLALAALGAGFVARRSGMLDLINGYCDVVLCVSDAVRVLAETYGVDPELTLTSYIGTQEASAWARTRPRPAPPAMDGTLTLAYLGYMRRDKGFYFLLDALETLPAAQAGRLRLRVAARTGPPEIMAHLGALRSRLAALEHLDGYTHDDLDRLLEGVHAGLVPVLWHDNLPQVAIEMHARHIPLLTSDMGGARELGGTSDLTFPAGDVTAFHACVTRLLDGEVDLDAYWRTARPPVDMAAHVLDLLSVYRSEDRSQPGSA